MNHTKIVPKIAKKIHLKNKYLTTIINFNNLVVIFLMTNTLYIVSLTHWTSDSLEILNESFALMIISYLNQLINKVLDIATDTSQQVHIYPPMRK